MKETGANTTTMQAVVAMTASPIWSAPSIEARYGRAPACTRFWMFSISTMASSTRMPMTRVKASSVTTFRLKPSTAMNRKVGTSETGMAMAVMTVERQSRRNSQTTSEARVMPSSMARRVAP